MRINMRTSIKAILFIWGTLLLFSFPAKVMAVCGMLDSRFTLSLPCIEFEGNYYSAQFSFYQNVLDPSGIYWKLDSIESYDGPVTARCADVGPNFDIDVPCVFFMGGNFGISLEYYANPSDSTHVYWRLPLDKISSYPVRLYNVIGGDEACFEFDMDKIVAVSTCYTNCPTGQPNCLLQCMAEAGVNFSFTVGLYLENPSSQTVEYVVPAGVYFSPDSSDVQPMLVIADEIVTVPPGGGTFCIPTYCMDSGLAAPDGDSYGAMDVASNTCLREIIHMVRGKNLGFAAVETIQQAVWHCMESGSITEEERQFLNSL